jgi:hypothetical protein
MVADPAATPVTIPVPAPTVALAVLLLLQAPPALILLNVMVEATQTLFAPLIGASGFTVTAVWLLQPVARVYIILGVPAATPVTIPDADPTVAWAVLLLLQVPPAVRSDKVVVKPIQTLVVPVITAGIGLTVIAEVIKHPVPRV